MAPAGRPVTWRDRARYRFDNLFARGTVALILGLFAASALIIVGVAFVLLLIGIGAEQELDFPTLIWYGLMRTLDAGTMGADAGSAGFLAGMLAVTLVGVFVLSTLIGIINAGIEAKLAHLRKGRSRVIETDHTVILGWSDQIHSIVGELVEANANRRRAAIAILADRDKVEMEDALRARAGRGRGTRIVCRSGSPLVAADLDIVSIGTARSVIILAPDGDEADGEVVKSLMAVASRLPPGGACHVVAEIRDPANLAIAGLIGGGDVELIPSEDVTSRIIAQTCRQSGLPVVYTELLGFVGDEIYEADVPSLVGRPFGELLTAFREATVIGLAPAVGPPALNPPSERLVEAGDRIVVVAPDDDRLELATDPPLVLEERWLHRPAEVAETPERSLILGWNRRALAVLQELDHYAPAGSETLVVADEPGAAEAVAELAAELRTQTVRFRQANTSDRATLAWLDLASFDHIVVLCYSDSLDTERADARTLITLLHLRDLVGRLARPVPIVSEMLDIRDRDLAVVARADDFIVSEELISRLVAQVSENRRLNAVYHTLLEPEGSEIYLRAIGDYVVTGEPVPFAALIESARRRGETAVGYRVAARAADPAAAYGIRLNPPHRAPVTFNPADRAIVLASR